jgi:hypothetical protein
MPKETLKQRDKRKLDLQLDKELEETFPASDPLKITRYSSETSAPTSPSRSTDTALGDDDAATVGSETT